VENEFAQARTITWNDSALRELSSDYSPDASGTIETQNLAADSALRRLNAGENVTRPAHLAREATKIHY
jgi:hypothetical protein